MRVKISTIWDLSYLGASMESSLSRRGLEMFLAGAMLSFSSVIVRRKRKTYMDKSTKKFNC